MWSYYGAKTNIIDHYPCGSRDILFDQLASWSRDRNGQVIVCESGGADWMDFKFMKSHRTKSGMQSEVFWSNYPTAFDNEQLSLF